MFQILIIEGASGRSIDYHLQKYILRI